MGVIVNTVKGMPAANASNKVLPASKYDAFTKGQFDIIS